MDAPGGINIAKVAVEYHDPSGVFPLISDQILSRLPLRNLHWKSPARPLRSIDSLHVDLQRSADGPDASRPSSVQSQTPQNPSASANPQQAPVKERRHQIPGLRQTPYLKLYLLRCDDLDSYKSTHRRAVREWLKSHAPPSQASGPKNAQENHDAFEWMILHVVVPNTLAAAQPRFGKAAKDGESGGAEKSTKFLGRSSSTLLEKLKADFNVSGKSSPDRISQLRLKADEVPKHLLPSRQGDSVSDYVEPPHEKAEAWNDIVNKLKSLILLSFDLRVGQYEEDIRERDSQRALPGWNFCTFFVLKEGLARGFESVGLVDDALAGYDELALGLDSILQNDDGATAIALLPYTDDLKDVLKHCADEAIEPFRWDADNPPISISKKSYRELILSNNISIFDFKCYIFARQMAILLRMGIDSPSKPKIPSSSAQESKEAEDLVPLAELCSRAAVFITSMSRILKSDLSKVAKSESIQSSGSIVENIADSWAYAVAQQLLDETNSSSLSNQSTTDPQILSSKERPSHHPPRRTSLAAIPYDQPSDESKITFERINRGIPAPTIRSENRSGRDELASNRAELMLIQRRIIEVFGERKKYSVGWCRSYDKAISKLSWHMTDISLDEDSENDKDSSASEAGNSFDGVCHADVSGAIASLQLIRCAYESLTVKALDHYFTAGRAKSFERMLADLAVIKYQLGDYAGAANCFGKVAATYGEHDWALIATELLVLYAACLKRLNRKDDYVRMLVNLIEKAVSQRTSLRVKSVFRSYDDYDFDSLRIDGKELLTELISFSAQLPYEVTVPMALYFSGISIDGHSLPYNDKDGFQLKMRFRHVLDENFFVDSASVKLQAEAGLNLHEIHLHSAEKAKICKGTNSIMLHTNITTLGTFFVNEINLRANKICFVHDLFKDKEVATHGAVSKGSNIPSNIRVTCFPKPEAFDATISQSRTVQIDKNGSLEIECRSGWNNVQKAEIRLKPASSGLRLRVANFNLQCSDPRVTLAKESGVPVIKNLQPHSSAKIVDLSYELEDNHKTILIRMDITYTTSAGIFEFQSMPHVDVELPVDVNVHDLFKSSLVFSRFNIRSSNEIPLYLLDVDLQPTDIFGVEAPPVRVVPTFIMAKQAATFMYKITQNKGNDSDQAISPRQSAKAELPLTLTIIYRCVDEEITSAILSRFKLDLEKTEFWQLTRLLLRAFKDCISIAHTVQHYTEAVMVGEMPIPTFDMLDWPSVLSDLPLKTRKELTSWLQTWHMKNASLPFTLPQTWDHSSAEFNSILPIRCLNIIVPLPRLHILHTTTLIPHIPSTTPAIPIGTPIPTTLRIKHTRRWDSPGALAAAIDGPADAKLQFAFELDAQQDAWIVGGQRRTRFEAREDEVMEWMMYLVPLRTGRLLLPGVEVLAVGKAGERLTCETDCVSEATVVWVVEGLGSTTVALLEGGMGIEPRLVETKGW